MLIDNFEQHFESCVLNIQNAQKNARNQINNLKFLWFPGFRIYSMAKNKYLEMTEINIMLCK